MNKADLVKLVSERTGVHQNIVAKTVQGTMEIIKDALSRGEDSQKITIMGFGTFFVQERKPRTGRNPKTGEQIRIASRKVVRFRPSRELNDNLG